MSDAQVLAALKEGEKDVEWFENHREELKAEHGDEYVAIKNQEVVASDPSLDGVVEKVESEGLNPGEVLVEFVSEVIRIL